MWRHLVAKFLINVIGATWWLNFQQMHVVTLADDDTNSNTIYDANIKQSLQAMQAMQAMKAM